MIKLGLSTPYKKRKALLDKLYGAPSHYTWGGTDTKTYRLVGDNCLMVARIAFTSKEASKVFYRGSGPLD